MKFIRYLGILLFVTGFINHLTNNICVAFGLGSSWARVIFGMTGYLLAVLFFKAEEK